MIWYKSDKNFSYHFQLFYSYFCIYLFKFYVTFTVFLKIKYRINISTKDIEIILFLIRTKESDFCVLFEKK